MMIFVQEYDAPCEAINATLLSCDAPQLPKDIYGSADQRVTLGLVMDGVTELLVLNQTIAVYTDPVFFPLTKDNSSLVFEEGEYSVINITVGHVMPACSHAVILYHPVG